MKNVLQIAIASGKGGTGKTSLAVALAKSLALSKEKTLKQKEIYLADCDVEEPNAKLFFSAYFSEENKETKKYPTSLERVDVPIPQINHELCTLCGKCVQFCQYNALARVGRVLVFDELCHSCGGCTLVCPTQAISEVPHSIGSKTQKTLPHKEKDIHFIEGKLDVGKALSPPIIRNVKKTLAEKTKDKSAIIILDSPPGASCPMTTTIDAVDFVVLVTEPTPFGLHDLKIAVETVRQVGYPFGVVINRSDAGDSRVIEYCESEKIPVLLEIKEDMDIAKAYSIGKSIVETKSEYIELFIGLYKKIEELVEKKNIFQKPAITTGVKL